MTPIEFSEIEAGRFTMGASASPHPEDGEGPEREIHLSPYRIASTTVSTADFADFVAQTGYITLAERHGSSHVFQGQLDDPARHEIVSPAVPWWRRVAGASWRRPDGATPADGALPVVHVALPDALAYCAWSGTRLPTEAEWERAAYDQTGIEPHIWRGDFPNVPTFQIGPRPVHDGKANENGLRHACGNIWEWTADRFTRLHSPRPDKNPQGPLNGSSFVVKGGSFLCSPSYCARFHPSSRRPENPEATTSHTGFRVAS